MAPTIKSAATVKKKRSRSLLRYEEEQEKTEEQQKLDEILRRMRTAVRRYSPQRGTIWVDYTNLHFEVRTAVGTAPCLKLEVRKDGRVLGTADTKTENEFATKPDVGVHIYVAQLNKCPPVLSGAKIMTGLLDALAACVDGARTIGLLDAAQLFIPQQQTKLGGICDLHYSPFLILATGESYYNQFGFFSANHDADKRHNAALIDLPFGTTVATLLKDHRAKGERMSEEEAIRLADTVRTAVLDRPSALRDLFGLDHLDYESSTRQIFAAIHGSKQIHAMSLNDDCSDPAFVWIQAVVTLFTVGGLRFDEYVEKPVAIAPVGGRKSRSRSERSTAADAAPKKKKRTVVDGGGRRLAKTRRRLSHDADDDYHHRPRDRAVARRKGRRAESTTTPRFARRPA
jgi:hypothetical protein